MSNSRRSLSNTYRNSVSANPELQRFFMQKQLSQQRLIKQLAFKDQEFQLFQNDHNLKLNQYSQQVNQEILTIKRKYQIDIDGLKQKIVRLEGEKRQSSDKQHSYQIIIQQMRIEIEGLNNQLRKQKQNGTEKQKDILKLAKGVQQLQAHLKESEICNEDMKQEIMVLLEVERTQGDQITFLKQKQTEQKNKINVLAQTLTQIQTNLEMFSDKIKILEGQKTNFKHLVYKLDSELIQKQKVLSILTQELQQSTRRQKTREDEVKHLIVENQRLYNDLGEARHKIHDLAVAYNINI